MDIRNIQVILRKRRLDEVFDLALLFVARNIGIYLRYAIIPAAFFTAVNMFVLSFVRNEETEWFSAPQALMILLVMLEQPLFTYPLLFLNGRLLFTKKPPAREVFEGVLSLLPRFAFGSLKRIFFILVLGPTLVAAWIGLVRDFFLGEVVVLERIRGGDVVRRLKALRSDRTSGFLMMDFGLGTAFLIAGTMSLSFVADTLGIKSLHWLLDVSFSFLSPSFQFLLFLYFVFHSAGRFLFYIDTRAAGEGWDIELMLLKGVKETDER